MLRSALLATAFLLALPAQAQLTDSRFESIVQMYEDEDVGLRHYERGNYDKAFDILSETAARGLKKSQYILSFMFLKGEHVNRSALLGLAWLGVAIESGDDEWIAQYDALYGRLNAAQQAMVDTKVAQYRERYGMAVMNVSCDKMPVTGSRRVETRCVKVEGPAAPIYPVELAPN